MFLLAILYFVLPSVQVGWFLLGREAFDPANTLNFASSILCFHWMLANVILSAKVPFLQRHAPYDGRIRFHLWATLGIGVTLVYHATYKFAAGKNIDAISWALLIVFAAMLFVAVLWIPLPGLATIRNWLKTRAVLGSKASYDRSKTIHGFVVLILTLLMFLHVANAGLFDDASAVSFFLYLVLYLTALVFFLLAQTFLFKMGATVLAVIENKGILTVQLAPDRKPRYRSGQFAFLRAQGVSGRKEEHPFSFLSTPSESEVRFAVRARGDFTRKLIELKPGDRVRFHGGYGNFRPGREKALCFVASGIGTVPFLSILKDLHAKGDARSIQFHVAVSHQEEIPDLDDLLKMAASMPNLRLNVLADRDDPGYSEDYFRKELVEPNRYTYYVCSSALVRGEVIRALRAIGVRRSSIRWEEFSLG